MPDPELLPETPLLCVRLARMHPSRRWDSNPRPPLYESGALAY
jgi:hypothetical protein